MFVGKEVWMLRLKWDIDNWDKTIQKLIDGSTKEVLLSLVGNYLYR